MNQQRGFSLIEVLMSLGLLAGVLLPTMFLLDTAARQAKSGRTASEALSVARSITEEMQGWGLRQIHWQYGLDGTQTSYVIDTRTNSYASRWQPMLDVELQDAHATITLQSLAPTSVPLLNSTRAIRITVTVSWKEQRRGRMIQVSTVRT
jgi:prepilin-type N-terminal cleavage/methylation domain-containing protein